MEKIPCEDCLLLPLCRSRFKKTLLNSRYTIMLPTLYAILSVCSKCELVKLYFNTRMTYALLAELEKQDDMNPKIKQFLEIMEHETTM